MAKTKPKTTRKAHTATRGKKAATPAKQTRSTNSKVGQTKRADRPAKARPNTKQALLIAQLQRKDGATIAELAKAIGWQAHSVRGAISGSLKKKLGLAVTSEKIEGRGRVYRVCGDH